MKQIFALLSGLIFGFGLGPDGAAWATVFSRIVFLVIGFRSVIGVHRMIARPSFAALRRDVRPTFAIAAPAILTNLANPIANACFFGIIAPFGDQAIAASAIIDRLVPVAFGVLFATVIILLLVPSLYMVLEDLKGLTGTPSPEPLTTTEEGVGFQEGRLAT